MAAGGIPSLINVSFEDQLLLSDGGNLGRIRKALGVQDGISLDEVPDVPRKSPTTFFVFCHPHG